MISKLYFAFHDLKDHIKTWWEAEGGFTITLVERERICRHQSVTLLERI